MQRSNIIRCYCNGESIGDGSSKQWAEMFNCGQIYICRLAKYDKRIIRDDGKQYTFSVVGVSEGNIKQYYEKPLEPVQYPKYHHKKRRKKKKPVEIAGMTRAQINAEGRKANRSYGYQVAYMEGLI